MGDAVDRVLDLAGVREDDRDDSPGLGTLLRDRLEELRQGEAVALARLNAAMGARQAIEQIVKELDQ